MKKMPNLIYLLFLILFISTPVFAKGNSTSAGKTLLLPGSARAAALGEAFVAATDDVGAFQFNPSSIQSLQSKQGLMMFQKGLADDSFGQVSFGSPLKSGAIGFSVNYYDGGNFDKFDGNSVQKVKAKTDLSLALGTSRKFGNISLGITGKYISSELAQTSKASAFAGDVGIQLLLAKGLQFGAALQNLGTSLKYVSESEPLPRLFRSGIAWKINQAHLPTTFLFDLPYSFDEARINPSVGLETLFGPLALRVGYRSSSDLQNLSFGAGFIFGPASIDYSYGLVKDLDSEHRVSVSMKFGEPQKDTQVQFGALQNSDTPKVALP